MEASRELDALVAEKVMGWQSLGDSWSTGSQHSDRIKKKESWHPSTDIAAAWEVLCALGRRGLGHTIAGHSNDHWCEFSNGEGFEVSATGESAPHAICLAALKAVGAL